MAEHLTVKEHHRKLQEAANALIEEYDAFAISTSLIVLQRHVDILRGALDQTNPIPQRNRLWAIWDRNGVRCSGWYLRRKDALNSVNYWRSDYYKRGYRCRRVEVIDD